MKETTILIPAYKPAGLLQTCVDSIIANTDLNVVDILIICNGSDIESLNYIIGLQNPAVKFAWYPEALGFTKATNIGLKMVTTPYIMLMNTDVQILNYWPKNAWLHELIFPLKEDSNIAVTGIAPMVFMRKTYFPFFHVGLSQNIMEKMGYLDEGFSPGYGEDLDYCLRVEQAGYKQKLINYDNATVALHDKKMFTSPYPIYHPGQGSFKELGPELAYKGYERVTMKHSDFISMAVPLT